MRDCLRMDYVGRRHGRGNADVPDSYPCRTPHHDSRPYTTPGSPTGEYLPNARCKQSYISLLYGTHTWSEKTYVPLTMMLGTISRGFMRRCIGTRMPGTFRGILGDTTRVCQVQPTAQFGWPGRPVELKGLQERGSLRQDELEGRRDVTTTRVV